MSHNVKATSYVITNTGLIRQNNEDNFYVNGRYLKEEEREKSLQLIIEENKREHIIAVCDGMGGESLGEFASLAVSKALQELENNLFRSGINTYEDKCKCIKDFVIKTNEKLCEHMKELGKTRMGTTLAGLYIKDDKAITFHLGDSRVYLYRAGILKQLTEDHTEAQRLVRLGVIDQEQASHHQNKHQLTRHFGILPEEGLIEPDISEEINIISGDIFLFCSDGLTDMVSDVRIEDILEKNQNTHEIHTSLIKEALGNGGHDNVTAIAVRIDGVELVSDLLRKKRSQKPNRVFKIATGILVVMALYIAFLLCKDIYVDIAEKGNSNASPVSANQQNGASDKQNSEESISQGNSKEEPEESESPSQENIPSNEDNSSDVTEETNSTENESSTAEDSENTVEETTENDTVIIPEQYTIKKGENLYQISRRFYGNNNAVKPIMQLNQIQDVDKIFVGQIIKLPTTEYISSYKEPQKPVETNSDTGSAPAEGNIPDEYTIKAGDNLFQISKKFYGNGSMVNEIVELNGLENAESIKVGQVIKLPKLN